MAAYQAGLEMMQGGQLQVMSHCEVFQKGDASEGRQYYFRQNPDIICNLLFLQGRAVVRRKGGGAGGPGGGGGVLCT